MKTFKPSADDSGCLPASFARASSGLSAKRPGESAARHEIRLEALNSALKAPAQVPHKAERWAVHDAPTDDAKARSGGIRGSNV